MILFGGVRQKKGKNSAIEIEYLNDMYAISVFDKTWEKLNFKGIFPQPRYRHSVFIIIIIKINYQLNIHIFEFKIIIKAFIVDDSFFVIGGSTNKERYGNLHKYDFKMNLWTSICFEKNNKKDLLFTGRYGCGTILDSSGNIFIYGVNFSFYFIFIKFF